MKAKRIMSQVIIGVCLIVGVVQAAALPEWLDNSSNLLPPVDESTRQEVNRLRTTMKENPPVPSASGLSIPLPYTKAGTRLVEIGEAVGQAMVWDYLEEPEKINPPKTGSTEPPEVEVGRMLLVAQNGQKKDEVLMILRHDPTLVKWLLPLLRQRMRWFQQAIDTGTFNRVISISEISGIEAYLYCQGTDADLETLHKIIRGLQEVGFEKRFFQDYPSLESQKSEIAEMRQIAKLHAQPYYQNIAFLLKSIGVEVPTANMGQGLSSERQSNRSQGKQSSMRESPGTNPIEAREDGPRTHLWLLIGVATVAVIGLLWLVLKRGK